MNNKIVQEILKQKINFAIFDIDELNQDEIEMIFYNIRSKISKINISFENMLKKEQIKQIIESENQQILNDKLEILDLSSLKNTEITIDIINKNFEKLQKITEEYNMFFNKKTLMIVIQYILSENIYTIDDIKKIISHIKNTFSMLSSDSEDEKVDILNDFVNSLDLSEKPDEIVNYISKLNDVQYTQMKKILSSDNDISDLLDIISQPYIEYYFNKSQKFVSVDIIFDFISKYINEENMDVNIIQKIITHSISNGILNMAILKQDVFIISKYLNIVGHFDFLNEYKRSYNLQNYRRIKGNFTEKYVDYSEHNQDIDISDLNKKDDIQIIEIIYDIEMLNLKSFFRTLKYDNDKVISIIKRLAKINIKTLYKLENLVLNNQFIKLCRQNDQKILPGKIIKMIIYKILDSHNKLDLLKEQNINIDDDIDILNMKMEKLELESKKDITIDDLKNKRNNLYNLILLLKQNEEDISKYQQELNDIDEKIKQYYLSIDSIDLLNENIDELNDIMSKMTLNDNEKNQLYDIVGRYKNEIQNHIDTFGSNFEKNEEHIFYNNNIDQNLCDIIEKYEKEEKEIEKENRKNFYHNLQNDLVEKYLKNIISSIDIEYNTKHIKRINMIMDFIKHKITHTIIPHIYKNFNLGDIKYNKNDLLYFNLKIIINVFCIMLNFLNKNISYDKIYSDINQIITNNQKIKKVIIKNNNKEVPIIEKNKNNVVVEYLGEELTLNNEEVTFIQNLTGTEITVIKGNYKGNVGKIYHQKDNYVLATKDYYGRNCGCSQLPRITIMKLKYDEFKINEIEQRNNFIIENKELYNFYNNKNTSLYAITKFEINKYISIDKLDNFEKIYKLCIELINEYKTNEYTKYDNVKQLKKEYLKIKNDINNCKNDKRKYITLNKKLKKLHVDIKNTEKNMDVIKETLINDMDNLNINYSYENVNNLYLLKEHIIQQEVQKVKVDKKKLKKEKKDLEKHLRNKLIDEVSTDIKNMISSLF